MRYYVQDGRLERVGRGLLRLVHFPPSDHEDLVVLWLWADREGVFSRGRRDLQRGATPLRMKMDGRCYPRVVASMWTSAKRRKSSDPRIRTAFHEAGHAVLSAAIATPPVHMTIKADGHTLGRSSARMSARPTSRVQVHLAGFAAEHLLTGRRPRQLDQEIGFSLVARLDPGLGEAYAGSESRDGHRAVEEVLRMASIEDDDAIRREIDRFYDIARESLSSVWASVKAVAEAVLREEELDRQGFEAALGDADLHAPVFSVQKQHGLLATRAGSNGHLLVAANMAHAKAIKTGASRAAKPGEDPRVVALLRAFKRNSKLAVLVEDFESAKAAPRGRKFGSNGLKVSSKLFALFTQGTLVVKLSKERVATLVGQGLGTPFDPGHGRVMKEWLAVTSPKASWTELAKEAHAFVEGSR